MTVTRAIERHRAAAVRAVAGDPTAELRGHRLTSRGRPVAVASPYIGAETEWTSEAAFAAARGSADALGLLLRNCNLELHRAQTPSGAVERIVFDVLEQLRCEALAPPLVGLRANIDAAFEAWSFGARSDRVGEQGLALLLYTVTHMARSRLVRSFPDEAADAVIEHTRATIAPIIGDPLSRLNGLVNDQAAFAEPARAVAELVAEVAGDASVAERQAPSGSLHRLLLPADWEDAHDAAGPDPAPGIGALVVGTAATPWLDELGGYRVFTRAYDIETTGGALYPDRVRTEARRELDELVAAQAVSPHRLAERLRRVFGSRQIDDWTFDQEDGLLDGRRLAQLVSNPDDHHVFRRHRPFVRSETAVAFLLDNSGSMKAHRAATLAVLIDTYSRALDAAGVTNEVLGFTTAGWAGAQPRRDWESAGRPSDPGRLNEALHIVYKDAETPWRRARRSLASLLRPHHFREGIDGEAIVWAHRRLLTRPEQRKVLVVVSDGAPMDAATANTNRDGFLDEHLEAVVDHIERWSPVEIAALSVDQDVSPVFRRSIPIDLEGTLTIGSYGALELLYGARMER